MARLTAEQIQAYRRPTPLAEDFPIAELDGDVHIQGIKDKAAYDAIQAEIIRLSEGKASLQPVLGYLPADREIVHASYAAECVDEPKLTSLQWLRINAEGFTFMPSLFQRILICSRLAEEQDKDQKTITPDGIGDAKEALKESGEADPLA